MHVKVGEQTGAGPASVVDADAGYAGRL